MPRQTVLLGAVGLSAIVHCSILVVFALIQWGIIEQEPIMIETVFSDDREQEEFSQDLTINTEVSETLNPVAGGVVTGAIGASTGPPISQARIETSQSLQDPKLVMNVREISLPGKSLLGVNLSNEAVMGETGAVVQGYGPAMSRLTRELLRIMRQQKVLAVWLFDESNSMVDDQKKIAEQFDKVYQELGIAIKKEDAFRTESEDPEDQIILTSICSFGDTIHYLTKKPTRKIETIRTAIDAIPIEESGKENMCHAIVAAVTKHRTMAARQDRKMVIIIVSDESGDDGKFVEQALQAAKQANSPIYILGREAIFGYPYVRQTWKDPKYGLTFWIRMRRGPETATVEALQWDGFAARDDAYPSGFGPYEQVRLAKDTGGIFFMLPGNEVNLSGRGAHAHTQFDFLKMKEYEPRLLSRRQYAAQVKSSKFRTTIEKVIFALDPDKQDFLSINRYHYRPGHLVEEGKKNFEKAVRALVKSNVAIALLTKVKPLRAHEASWRWRAAYDLMYGQLHAYRVRLFQYLLALDQLVKNPPPFKNPKNNEWRIRYTQELLPPDPAQVAATNIDLDEIKTQRKKATELYHFVIKEHPGTPWSTRAKQELAWGFGIKFNEYYWDPRHYNDKLRSKIDVPSL